MPLVDMRNGGDHRRRSVAADEAKHDGSIMHKTRAYVFTS